MGCVRDIGGRCRDEKHWNRRCGWLRKLFCKTRKEVERALAKKRVRVEQDFPELGMGA